MMSHSDHLNENTAPLPLATYITGYVGTLLFYLAMWGVAAVVIVGVVGMTFGPGLDTSLVSLVALAGGLFLWNETPEQDD